MIVVLLILNIVAIILLFVAVWAYLLYRFGPPKFITQLLRIQPKSQDNEVPTTKRQ